MECRDVATVLEQEGLSPLPLEARDHLNECEACRDLLADLSAIVVAAKRIPAEENPPERVWVSLRAQLEAEGIIGEAKVAAELVAAEPWWQGLAPFLRPRMLAMVSAGILAVAGGLYISTHHTKTAGPAVARSAPPAVTQTAQPPNAEKAAPAPLQPAAPMLSAENVMKKQPGRTISGANKPPQIRESTTALGPSPSELASYGESAAVLDQTESAMPSPADNAAVAEALRENLRTLNEFIAECKARLKENPGDRLTQEYLNMALQQKAELLGAMMDSRGSEH